MSTNESATSDCSILFRFLFLILFVPFLHKFDSLFNAPQPSFFTNPFFTFFFKFSHNYFSFSQNYSWYLDWKWVRVWVKAPYRSNPYSKGGGILVYVQEVISSNLLIIEETNTTGFLFRVQFMQKQVALESLNVLLKIICWY